MIEPYPLLTKEREKELFAIMRNGNEKEVDKAREELILSNLRLVIYCAKKMKTILYRFKVDMKELIEWGNLELIYATKTYDEAKGGFATFASTSIMYFMTKMASEKRLIRIPPKNYSLINRINRLLYNMDNPTNAKIAKELKTTESMVEALLKVQNENVVSMEDLKRDNAMENGEYSNTFDFIDENTDVIHEVQENEKTRMLLDKISRLTTKQQKIMTFRLIDGLTIAETAKKMGVSRQNVDQITKYVLKTWTTSLKVDVPNVVKRKLKDKNEGGI